MIKRVVFGVLFILVLGPVSAQKKVGFKPDGTQFPEEIKAIILTYLAKDEMAVMDTFTIDWGKNVYDASEKEQIASISNLLYERKANPLQYKSLLYLIITLKKKSPVNFTVWLSYMPIYIKGRRVSISAIADFIGTILDLQRGSFLNNNSLLQWKYIGGDFVFRLEKETLSVLVPPGNLKCYSKRDSIGIQNTSGVYYPVEKKWKGNGGLVTWERAGHKSDEVNAQLKRYKIDLNRFEYTADSIIFTFGKYFKKPVLGTITDKVLVVNSKESAIYPEFDSYNKHFVMPGLYENVDYEGGFSMKGAKIIGSGSETEDARISVKKMGRVVMKVQSKYFAFSDEWLKGYNCGVIIYLHHDSIYHSDLGFTYNVAKQEVNLTQSDDYSSKSPYFNSYHKVDMTFDQLNWKISEPNIYLTIPKIVSVGKAKFESHNFFRQVEFDALQGMNSIHPLVALRKFSRVIKSEKFTAEQFAHYIGRQFNETRQSLMELAQSGYIYYNSRTDLVTFKRRLNDCLNSSIGSIDFDVLDIVSNTRAPLVNGIINTETYDLTINGIPSVSVSDSQNVVIYPAKNRIVMKENRSFQFDGVVDAGLFTFYGHNFFFDYKEFKINLQNVDSVTLSVLTGKYDNLGRPLIQKIYSTINHLTGELLIDKPNNKSGRKNFPEYPIFNSREKSYVYYNRKSIQNGVYPDTSFFFELAPFSIDSLDNFTKAGVRFAGNFQSSDILPKIAETLTVQPDYSLGFKHVMGPEGLDVYKGKGHISGVVNLTNNGLRSSGKLQYITSTTTSKDFLFYPKVMTTKADSFVVARQVGGVEFPQTNTAGNAIEWKIPENKMLIAGGAKPFRMFNDQTSLTGKLVLEPKGLSGAGQMNLTTAEMQSRLFRYKSEIIDADTARFLLKSLTKEGYTVLTKDNVNAHIDFIAQKGEFTANDVYARIDFPENKYISFINYFKWNMDDKTLELGSQKHIGPLVSKGGEKEKYDRQFSFAEETDGPRYISVHPKQDSLNFIAPKAIYDYKNNIIRTSEVKLIRVADAIIYPSDGKVNIALDAQMEKLSNTRIVANYQQKYHTLYSAEVNITGRQRFTGQGKYDYVDENNKVRVLDMTEIKVDTALHTIATTKVLEPDSFKINPYLGFQGDIVVNSSRQLLTFKGGAEVYTNYNRLKPSLLKFESEIDPKNAFIPVSDVPVSMNNNKIYAGIFIASDSIHVYPSFLSGRRTYSDKYIASAQGYLRYNKFLSVYEIASKQRLMSLDSLGNYVSLNPADKTEHGEGRLNLGADLGQVKLGAYGNVNMDVETRQMALDVMLSVDFMFAPKSLENMAYQISNVPNLAKLDTAKLLYGKGIREMLGEKGAAKFRSESASPIFSSKEFPAGLSHTIYFTQLRLKWNEERHSYISEGLIGVGNVLNVPVNRMVEGLVEITKKRSGDLMDIYLKLDDNTYYYFGYTRGTMQATSSNQEFKLEIDKIKGKLREMNVPRGQTPYAYLISTDAKYGNFIRDYNKLRSAQPATGKPKTDDSSKKNQPAATPKGKAADKPGNVKK
ncbi:MAG: hypothetical protein Q8928_12465 [Bacteroidota bacterium]|nr:hypothetical protein [Bacteroidota bacterium]